MRVAAVLLALWVVLAGTLAPVVAADDSPADSPAAASTAPADPATDVIGWENGYWHNESIDVNQSDGLSDAELEAFVARSMARVEYIRDREFEETVPVSVLSRSTYQNQTANRSQTQGEDFGAWNNQVWEALFITGERNDVQSEIGSTLGSSVAGFYSPRDDEIKIITDTPDSPTIDNATLVHELVHALQDQQFNLSDPTYQGTTQDDDLAIDGVVEGEANYVEAEYAQRCASGEWECVAAPSRSGGGGGGGPNLGILLTLLNPYSDGPVYVHDVFESGGWDAVDEAFRHPPNSSEQVIHLTSDEPRPIEYEDRARGEWALFPDQGQNGSDTVGEASIYAMFWYQARNYGADTVDPRGILDTTAEYDLYNYNATPSAGWANDRVFPYRSGTGDDAEYGYVWVTEWDTLRDAREFEAAYLAILEAHDVRQRSDGVYVVDDGPWADSFRVVRQGTRVTVVNGPTPAAVDDLRPGLVDVGTATTTPTTTPATTTPTTDAAATTTATDTTATATSTTEPGDTTDEPVPGFGVAVALVAVALAVAGLLARR